MEISGKRILQEVGTASTNHPWHAQEIVRTVWLCRVSKGTVKEGKVKREDACRVLWAILMSVF